MSDEWTLHVKVYELGKMRDLDPSLVPVDLLRLFPGAQFAVEGKRVYPMFTSIDLSRRTVTYAVEVLPE